MFHIYLSTTINGIGYLKIVSSSSNLFSFGGIVLAAICLAGIFRIIQIKLLLKESDKDKIPIVADFFVKTSKDSIGSIVKEFIRDLLKGKFFLF